MHEPPAPCAAAAPGPVRSTSRTSTAPCIGVSLLALDGPAPSARGVARRPQRLRHRPGRRSRSRGRRGRAAAIGRMSQRPAGPDGPIGAPSRPTPDDRAAAERRAGRRRANPVRPLRLSPQRARLLRPADPAALMEQPARPRPGRLAGWRPGFEGAWPYLRADRRLQRHRRPPRSPGGRGVLDRQRAGRGGAGARPDGLGRRPLRFRRGRCGLLASAGAACRGVPQHSFHVFAVYPWLGLLRAGKEGRPSRCSTVAASAGVTVEAVTGDTVTVRSRPLAFRGPAPARPGATREGRHSLDGIGPRLDLQRGGRGSLHWDWLCDRLSPTALGWLRQCTDRNLHAVNAAAQTPAGGAPDA